MKKERASRIISQIDKPAATFVRQDAHVLLTTQARQCSYVHRGYRRPLINAADRARPHSLLDREGGNATQQLCNYKKTSVAIQGNQREQTKTGQPTAEELAKLKSLLTT